MLTILPPTVEFMGSSMDHAGNKQIAMAMMAEGGSLREPLVLHPEQHFQPSSSKPSNWQVFLIHNKPKSSTLKK